MIKHENINRKGRPKGAKTKISSKIKDFLASAVDDYISSEQFLIDLNQLSPEKRINAYLKMTEFIIPKQTRIEGDGLNNTIQIVWNEEKVYQEHTETKTFNMNELKEIEKAERRQVKAPRKEAAKIEASAVQIDDKIFSNTF